VPSTVRYYLGRPSRYSFPGFFFLIFFFIHICSLWTSLFRFGLSTMQLLFPDVKVARDVMFLAFAGSIFRSANFDFQKKMNPDESF
jgi:hypothetical protein